MTTDDHLATLIDDPATTEVHRILLRSIRAQVEILTRGLHSMSTHATALAAEVGALKSLCSRHGLTAESAVARFHDAPEVPPARPWNDAAFADGKAQGFADIMSEHKSE